VTKTNEDARLVLDKLWKFATENDGYFKLDNDSAFVPLTIEIIEPTVISICHYGEMNFDPMRDPEMLFWKNENGDYFPYYFRNDYAGIEDILGEVANDKLVSFNEKHQISLVEFSNIWLENIECQQFRKG